MKFEFDIPEYRDSDGIEVFWSDGARYKLWLDCGQGVALKANKEGLISFAKQMLYLAYNDFPEAGVAHVHFDPFFTKNNDNEFELTLIKEDVIPAFDEEGF